ncbi:hypothetical protein Ancab_005567 [Ancistrocladus abbreviatus]
MGYECTDQEGDDSVLWDCNSGTFINGGGEESYSRGQGQAMERLASVWGSLISLDGATSFNKRYDVARIFISTKVFRPISKMILVMVEGHKFLIQVIEESSGETIFSRGLDWEKVSRSVDGKNMLFSSLVVPYSLAGFWCSGGKVSPEMARGIEVEENSKSLENNDERSRNSDGFGQSHRVQEVRRKVNESPSVELLLGRYVSSPGKQPMKVIKGDEIEVIMRRKEDECAACSTLSARTKSPDIRHKIDSSLGNFNATGPSVLRPKKQLVCKDQSLCTAWAADSEAVGCP